MNLIIYSGGGFFISQYRITHFHKSCAFNINILLLTHYLRKGWRNCYAHLSLMTLIHQYHSSSPLTFTARVIRYKTYLCSRYYHGDRSGMRKDDTCALCSRVTECSSCFINYIKRENSHSKHYQIDTTAIHSSMKLVLLLSVVGIVAISNCFARSKYMKCFTTTHWQHNLIRLFQSNVNRVVLLWCLYKMKLGFFFLSDTRTWQGFSCVTF